MRTRTFLTVIAMFALCCTIARAESEAAAREFANGQALLAKADLQGALAAFKAAVKAEPENNEYFQHYGLLQRVLKMRAALDAEKDADTWVPTARALYSFYSQYKLYGEALPLARGLYDKAPSGDSAATLADTLLALDKNADAAALLAALDASKVTPSTLALHGLALARVGKADAAKTVAGKVEIPQDAPADLYYVAARLYAQLGDNAKAVNLLTRAFESTPADQLDTAKADAKASKDLAKLSSTPEFAKALETKSKAPACGTKAACGKCPMKDKGSCPEKGKEGAKDAKEAGCEHEKKAGKE